MVLLIKLFNVCDQCLHVEKVESKASFLYHGISSWKVKEWIKKKFKNTEIYHDYSVYEIGNKN